MTAKEYLSQVLTYRNNAIRAGKIGNNEAAERYEREYKAFMQEVTDKLQSLGNETYATVLFARYIEHKTAARVAAELNYSPKHIFRLQKEALMTFETKYLQDN